MSRINIKMPSPESAVAGQTATFKLPIGHRYHGLHLVASATAIAVSDINEIRVLCNNKPIQRFTGSERNAMNLFDGRADAAIDAASFILTIPFDRFNLGTRIGEEETAINTGSPDSSGVAINQFSVEIDLASGITGTIVLALYADVSERLAGGAGTIPFIIRTTRDLSGTGEKELSDLPRGGAESMALDRIFFKPSANNITTAKIEINQRSVFERTSELNNRLQSDGVRVPQSGYFVIDRTEFGYGADPIGLVSKDIQDFRYKLTIDGSMSLVLLAGYLGKVID